METQSTVFPAPPTPSEDTITSIFDAFVVAHNQGHVSYMAFAENSAQDNEYTHILITFKSTIFIQNVEALINFLYNTHGIVGYIVAPTSDVTPLWRDDGNTYTIKIAIPRSSLPQNHDLYQHINCP